MSTFDPRALPLIPEHADRCAPPVCVDDDGRAVADPYAVLLLPPGPLPHEQVLDAARQRLIDCPPERSPREAQRVLEARSRLLDPQQLEARHLGVLHVPDPEAWGCARPGGTSDDDAPLTPLARLLGQALLYTLVEEALWTDGLGALYEEAITRLVASGGAGGER